MNINIAYVAYLLIFFFLSYSVTAQQSPVIADGAELELISDEFTFTEGPAVDKNGNVYFTDQPSNRIMKWMPGDSISVFMEDAGRANGLYFDQDGNLLACADEKNQLWQISPNKEVSVLVEDFEGKRLNGPNDLWVDKQGGIYFTDPFYKREYWNHDEKEIETEAVYYLSPDKNELKIVADNLVKPNGIIGTADGNMLFIADIGDEKTFSYSINDDGSLSDKSLFVGKGSDGLTLDNQNNLYLTGDGVTVFNKNGEEIEHISIPENWTANVTFGGEYQQILFITASNSIYSLEMKVNGIR